MAAAAVLLATACQSDEVISPSYNEGINVVPAPVELSETENGLFKLNKNTVLVAQGEELQKVVEFVAEKMRTSTGLPLKVEADHAGDNSIIVSVDPSIMENYEGYTLQSDAKNVTITGASLQGAYYGLQTMLQLLPAEIESPKLVSNIAWEIPSVEVTDYPRFHYRGFLMEPSRHFATVEDVKKHLDVLSMLKINKMHWHLTEDQGWRIEIKKYPKLTEVGSVRDNGDGTKYGPYFYTQEEVKEIVAYAQERFIEVIPEIELPGHALAALTAYPELACFPKKFQVRNVWGVEDDVYCAGKEEVFQFLEDVLSEVIPLFPSKYFHIGGDECPKKRWAKCPLCQKRMRQNGLKDEHELQSYFVQRIGKFLEGHGKAMIGWDEILEGGLAPSAIVMSWRGEDGGIAAANMDHEVIMTPGSGGLYIDHYQGDPKIEPVAIGGYSTLEKVYSYNPLPEALDASKHHYVLGAQANLWAEYLYDSKKREYMAYPRTIALAEVTWTPLERKDFTDFCRRLNNTSVRLDMHDMFYHIPLPEQPGGSLDKVAFVDEVTIPFKTTRPVKVVYTLDGSDPQADSQEYTEPITFTETTTLKIASVLPSGVMSRIREIEVVQEPYHEPVATPDEVDEYTPGLAFAINQEGTVVDGVTMEGNVGNTISMYKGDTKELNDFSVMTEGYFLVPEDGIYVFSSDVDKVWVNGDLIIDNSNEVNKYSRKDTSLALAAGLHQIKYEFRNVIRGGWPSIWSQSYVSMKKYGGEEGFKPIAGEGIVFH